MHKAITAIRASPGEENYRFYLECLQDAAERHALAHLDNRQTR
jgi:hypothetical protein